MDQNTFQLTNNAAFLRNVTSFFNLWSSNEASAPSPDFPCFVPETENEKDVMTTLALLKKCLNRGGPRYTGNLIANHSIGWCGRTQRIICLQRLGVLLRSLGVSFLSAFASALYRIIIPASWFVRLWYKVILSRYRKTK